MNANELVRRWNSCPAPASEDKVREAAKAVVAHYDIAWSPDWVGNLKASINALRAALRTERNTMTTEPSNYYPHTEMEGAMEPDRHEIDAERDARLRAACETPDLLAAAVRAIKARQAARAAGDALRLDNPRAEARLAADLATRCECPNCERGSLDFHAGVWTCDRCEYTREHDGLDEDGWPVHGSQA